MIRGLAAITLKYDTSAASAPLYDPARTEELIGEMKNLAEQAAIIREKMSHEATE